MGWREEAEARLPRPSPSEPQSLRADILDELADHLGEAMARERRGGAVEEAVAWERAVHRFGDPARIALQLWWQAMGEQVMRERFQTVVLVAVLAVMAFTAVMSYRQNQQSTAVLAALAGALQQNIPASANRMVEIHATREGQASTASGLHVEIEGSVFGDKSTSVWGETDAKGVLSIGPIRTGIFSLQVRDDTLSLTRFSALTLFPNTAPQVEMVQVPNGAPVTVEFKLDPVLLGKTPHCIAFTCRYGTGRDAWSTSYILFVDSRAAGILTRQTYATEFSSSPITFNAVAPLAKLRATEEIPPAPVRPNDAVAEARQLEFPAATEIEIIDLALGGGEGTLNSSNRYGRVHPKIYPVSPGTANKLSIELDPTFKTEILAALPTNPSASAVPEATR